MSASEIIKIQGTDSCNSVAFEASPGTAAGGVHCDTGNNPIRFTGVFNGTTPLYVGDGSTSNGNLLNDAGATLFSLTLYDSHELASDQDTELQYSDSSLLEACAVTTNPNGATSWSNCGSDGGMDKNPALRLKRVWGNGTGVATGGEIPKPAASLLLGVGLLGLGWYKRTPLL